MIKFLDLSSEIVPIRLEIDEAINKVVTKNNFVLGDELYEFERNFANYIGTEYCIGVANGTDALEIAVKSLNLNVLDDMIITQANTFVATCLGATNNNIGISLVDINPKTYQMNLEDLEEKIRMNKKIRVVIVVHLTGSCCDMDKLMDIIKKYNLILIEDCAQSHGSTYKGKRLGSFGDISTFSFYPGKNLGAFGDGGAICINNKNLSEQISKIRNLGSIEKYRHEVYGRNSRLDTLQASILNVKLKYLDTNNEKRRGNAKIYDRILGEISEIEIPEIESNCLPVYHLYIIRTNKRDQLKQYLEENDIQTGIHYPLSIPELECYKYLGSQDYSCAITNSKRILSLPMYPNLSENEIIKVCEHIKNFFN